MRWLPLALAAGVLAGFIVHAQHEGSPAASPSRPSTVASASPSGVPAPEDVTPAPPVVTELGRRLLGVDSGWELFGRGPGGVVRIEFARGRVTRTAVAPLASTGPVSFVVGRNWAMIRPLDYVPGYVVRDGQPAEVLTGALGQGGLVLPGPDQETVWVPTGTGTGAPMAQVGVDGRLTGVSSALPPGPDGYPEPDGTGYLLLSTTGGTYVARPDGVARITTGTLLAVGPSRWLALECDGQHRCADVVIDRSTGARRTIGRPVSQGGNSPGVISPGGGAAALLEAEPGEVTAVHLLDLATGTDRRLDVPIDRPSDDASMVWSPDSRWLFIAGAGGTLYPVDAATGRVRDLGVDLAPAYQLAIRNAAP